MRAVHVPPEADVRLRTFAELFAPGLTAWVDPYVRDTYAEIEGKHGWQWRPCKRPINLWRGLAAHIAAGAENEPQPFRDDERALTRAIGLGGHATTLVSVVNVDLDGMKYDPAAVVAAVLSVVGPRFLVTSGSGKPGRYRVLMPIAPLPQWKVQEHMAELLGELGYPPVKGGVEVYPSRSNSRLPFGAGGCLLFDRALKGPGERRHPYALLDELVALPRVELAAVVQATKRRAAAPEPLPARPRLEAATSAAAVEPSGALSLEEQVRAARAVLAQLGPRRASVPAEPVSPPSVRGSADVAGVGPGRGARGGAARRVDRRTGA